MSKLTLVVLAIAVTIGVMCQSQDVVYVELQRPYPPGYVDSVDEAVTIEGGTVYNITTAWIGQLLGSDYSYFKATVTLDNGAPCGIMFERQIVIDGGYGQIENPQLHCFGLYSTIGEPIEK